MRRKTKRCLSELPLSRAIFNDCYAVIDIHSHVLFGMDDGAPDIEERLAMLRIAAAHGTTDIVGTPHANLEYKFDPALISECKAQLEERLGNEIRIHTGCDFHLQYENIEDALRHPRKYTIAGGPYLLVEFSDLIIFKTTGQIFSDLLGAGMIPVITHPERNALLQQRLSDLKEWVAMGCAIQVTGQSLEGVWGSRALKFGELLMDEELVHVIASDGHDRKRRPPVLDSAYALVMKKWGEPSAQSLFVKNPGAILHGEKLNAVPARRKKSFFSFFR